MQDKYVTGLTTNTPVSAGGNVAVLNTSRDYVLVDKNGKEYPLFLAGTEHYLLPCSAPQGGLLAVCTGNEDNAELAVSLARLEIRGRGDYTLQTVTENCLRLAALGYRIRPREK